MPVEIRELIIRAVVQKKPVDDTKPAPFKVPDAESIIDECVRQVMKLLKTSGER